MPKIKQPKKLSGRPRKEKIVEEISQKLEKSDSLILTDYQGLTHKQIEVLKKNLKKSDSSFSITKNTLLKISIEKSKKYADLLKEHTYESPTAVLFIKGDVTQALKLIAKANKDFGLPKIKVGIIDGLALDEAQVLRLSSLPNRETLLAQLGGVLNSPISGFVFVLNANLQKLVFVLSEISKKAPASAPATPAEQVTETAPATAEASPVSVEPAVTAAEPTGAPEEKSEEPEEVSQTNENVQATKGGDN